MVCLAYVVLLGLLLLMLLPEDKKESPGWTLGVYSQGEMSLIWGDKSLLQLDRFFVSISLPMTLKCTSISGKVRKISKRLEQKDSQYPKTRPSRLLWLSSSFRFTVPQYLSWRNLRHGGKENTSSGHLLIAESTERSLLQVDVWFNWCWEILVWPKGRVKPIVAFGY